MRLEELKDERDEAISEVDLEMSERFKSYGEELIAEINGEEPYPIEKIAIYKGKVIITSNSPKGDKYWKEMEANGEIQNREFPDTRYSSDEMDELFDLFYFLITDSPDFTWDSLKK
jgi:hypothetical protein